MKKNNTPSLNCQLTRKSLYVAMATISHLMLSATPALAAPAGGKVVGGGGSIDQSGLNTTIRQQTDRMAIDWQSFNVADNEKVKFIQPGSSSVALNRVLSHTGSEIHGQIEANGHILLVNPNGVVFGKDSHINVGGMIASGLHIDPNDFMNGEFTLTAIEGTEGKVINSGIINAATGGSVTLAGQQVKNEGLISAKLGAVNLAAGKEAVITFDASGLVGVRVTEEVLQNELGIDAAVINSGEINAEGGRILLSASTSQDIFSQAVNHGNLNSATSVVVHEDSSFTLGAGADVVNTGNLSVSSNSGGAGKIVLIGENVTTSGNIHADAATTNAGQIELHSVDTTLITDSAKITAKASSTGKGGDVKILGNKVGLLDNTQINASGANGGGEILFGGDETGNNIRIRNADFIYLGENSKVNADAIFNGNGGRVITFASDTARIYGDLSARGGALGGNGGFVETSGLKSFEILKTPDVKAIQGAGGHWLIDPYDITIQADGEIDEEVDEETHEGFKFESGVRATTLNVGVLENALTNGVTVTVRTTGENDDGLGNGDINFATNLDYDFDGSATLILDAHNKIDLGAFSIKRSRGTHSKGSLNIDFRAGGDVNFGTGAQVITYGGTFTASGVDFTLPSASSDDFFVIDTSINPGGSSLTPGGDITLNMTGATSLGSSIRTDGGSFTVIASSSFTNNFEDAVIDTSNDFGGGDVSITSTGNVDLGQVNFKYDYEIDAIRSGSIVIDTEGDVVLHKEIDFNNTEIFHDTVSDEEDSSLSITAGGNISILSNITDEHPEDERDIFDITLDAVGAINIQGSISTSGGSLNIVKSSSFTTGSGASISTRGEYGGDSTNTFFGNVDINSSGTVSLGAAVNTNGGKVTINAGDTVTLSNINTKKEDADTSGELVISGMNVATEAGQTLANINVEQSSSTSIKVGSTEFNVGTGTVALAGDNNFTGDMTISSAGTVDIKNISAGFNLGESNITGNLTLTAAGNITQSGKVGVTGTTNLSAGEHAITLDNAGNNFGEKVTITSAREVTIVDADDLTVGTINTQGNVSNRNGGNVNLTANGTITVDDINTSGLGGISGSGKGGNGGAVTINSTLGNVSIKKIISSGGDGRYGGSDNRDGGDAGEIEISGQKIILGGDLFSQAGQRGRSWYADGDGKDITLNGNIELTADITLGADVETEANTQKRGNIIIDGSVDSDSVAARNLTLTANNITFREHVGSIRLGDLNINAVGDVIAQSADTEPVYKNITANTLNASATDFHVGDINTKAVDTAGRGITIAAEDIRVGALDSSGLGTENGGAIVISASGDDDAKIVLAGDINSQSGDKINQGEINVKLLSAGSVFLNHTDFFTSTVVITGSNSSNGIDTLKGFDLDIESTGSTWSIDGVNSNIGDGTSPNVSFSGFENLIGGTGNDTFTFAGENNAGSVTSINGGGGDGENTLIGRDAKNTWEVGATNSLSTDTNWKYVTAFENIDSLQGGNDADTFNIKTDFNGTLLGGNGEDVFNIDAAVEGDLSGGSDTDIFNIKAAVVGALLGGSGNDQFTFFPTGSATRVDGEGGDSDTLTGRNEPNTWTISADNAGSLKTGSGSSYVREFAGIEALQGGNAVDTFDISANFTGSLYGGGNDDVFNLGADVTNAYGDAGNDKFIITAAGINASLNGGGDGDDSLRTSVDATTNVWTISDVDAGSLVNGGTVNFEGMKRLNGSSGVDEFRVNALFNGVINGSDGADVFNLNADVGGGVNGDKGDDVFNIAATVGSPLNGGADDDRFNILASGISVNINGGSDSNDTVQSFDDAVNDNVWQLDGAFSGTLKNSVGSINFSGIETLEGGSGTDTLQGRDQINNWQITGNGSGTLAQQTGTPADTVKFSGMENITGGNFDDYFTFGAFGIISGVLNGGDGTGDTGNKVIGRNTENHWDITGINTGSITDLTLDPAGSYVAGFENIQHLIGGSGADTFELKGGHVTTIKGGDGSDTLKADDWRNTWTLDSASSGTLLASASPTDYSLTFNEVENLTGNKQIDTFIFDTTEVYGGVIDAVGDDNIVSIVGNADAKVVLGKTLNGVENANIIMGNGSGSITVIDGTAEDVHNWVISDLEGLANGINDGSISNGKDTIRFIDFAYLNGSDATDNFTLESGASITGEINGDEGVNTFTNKTADSVWSLTDRKLTNNLSTPKDIASFSNIQTITGSGSDTLKTTTGTNTWTINAADAGEVELADKSEVKFINFSNLEGGDGNDIFNVESFGSISGNISGGGGSSTLRGRDTNNTWNINPSANTLGVTGGTAYVNSFTNIQTLKGGDAVDTFAIDSVFNGTIHGGAGDDIFNINAFVNTLLGEAGDDKFDFSSANNTGHAENIYGSDGDDRLIGRHTNSTWNLTDTNSLRLTNGNGNGAVYVGAFTDIQILQGGNAVDTFNINRDYNGSIYGGAGNDIFEINAAANALFGEAGNDQFLFNSKNNAGTALSINGGNGRGEENILHGRNVASNWNITPTGNSVAVAGAADGYVTNFSNIQMLQGSNAVDTFEINEIFTGNIRGGSGNDIFNINAESNALFGEAGDDRFYFSSENNKGTAASIDGGDNNDSIFGRHAATIWLLDASGSTLSAGGSEYVSALTAMEVLQGGDAIDTFNINSVFGLILGGAQNDIFNINASVNTLLGQGGDDQFIFSSVGNAGRVENIDGGDGDDLLIGRNAESIWNLTAAKDSLRVTNGAEYVAAFTDIQTLRGGNAVDTFNIDRAYTGSIYGGAGNDVFEINDAVNELFGEVGNDEFTFTNAGSASLVNGGAGTNTLIGRDADNIWRLTGAHQGSLKQDQSAPYVTSFIGIHHLTGGSQNHTDTLIAHDQHNQWNIDDTNKGSVGAAATPSGTHITFTDMENISGGALEDNFIFSSNGDITGLIDGGTHGTDSITDSLDLSDLNDSVEVELFASTSRRLHVVNMETITAPSASAANNHLYGASDQSYAWTINGTNAGSVAVSGSSTSEPIVNFKNFARLRGGTNDDRFEVVTGGTIEGTIHGGDGDGIDSVDYSNTNDHVIVSLVGGGLSDTGIEGIEGVIGNNNGDNPFNSLIGIESGNNLWTLGNFDPSDPDVDGINDGQITIKLNDGTSKTISFVNFNIIDGGSGDDEFHLFQNNDQNGIFIGYINGGGGSNLFNAGIPRANTSASAADQTIYIKNNPLNLNDLDAIHIIDATHVFGFDNVIANASTNSTLISAESINIWNIKANDANTLIMDDNEIDFSGFTHLTGGGKLDTFNVLALDGPLRVIEGGAGSAIDVVDFSKMNANTSVTVGVGETASADINIVGIEQVDANNNNANELISDASVNTWSITAKNSGSLTSSNLYFNGFANLTGGEGNDTFSMVGDAAALTGIINGGAGEGTDALDVTALDRPVTVALSGATAGDADVHVMNLETVKANGDHANTLIATNTTNEWKIDGSNTGSINIDTSTMTFDGFHNLIGGNGNDHYQFTETGKLSGYIDGSDQAASGEDIVDLQLLALVDITLSQSGPGYRNIERFIGNDEKSTLTASGANTWNLTGMNAGNLNETTFFEGFSSLVGGEGNDQFNLTQGSLSGSVFGGDGDDTFKVSGAVISGSVHGDDGNDTFEVSDAAIVKDGFFGEAGNDLFKVIITAGGKGEFSFSGGAGDNSIEASGGNADYDARHSFTGTSGGLLRYTDKQNNVYNLSYSGVNDIFDGVTADLLTVTTTSGADTLTLTDGGYSLNQITNVSYSDKTNLTIAASAADEVIVSGAVNVPELLTIQGARVSAADNNSVIDAEGLLLEGTAEVGTSTNRVNVSINDLYVRSANGAIYLQEQSGLNIGEFSTSAAVDLSLDGDLTSSVALSSSQDISINTSNGSINLGERSNALSGGLYLAATNSIDLLNLTTTNLKDVSARDLIVNSAGIINGGGLIQVEGLASLESGGNINLANQNHNFNFVQIKSATNVSINNSDSLNLTGVSASGAVDINAQGINVNGLVNAPNLMLNAGQGDAVLGGKVAVIGIANVTGRNITVDGDLLAANIQLDGSQGQVLINGRLNTESKESITVTANRVVQNGLVSAGAGVTVRAADSLAQNAAIMAGTDASLSAGGTMVLADITATKEINISAAGNVNQNGNIVSSVGDIVIDSGGYNMNAGAALTADAGSVLLSSSGDLTTREISAARDVSLAASGYAQLLDQVTTTNGAISIQGGHVTLASNVIGNAGIEVTSANGDIRQQAQLESAQGDIRVVADGTITMDANSSTLSSSGSIEYSGANLGITSLDALKTVTLEATRGAVTDLSGNNTNITAQRLVIDSATGIGSNDIIETLVDELSVSNNVGDIRLQNNKAVTVDRLRSNGNIVFNNLVGSVTLDNSQGTLFSRSETDARLAGGTMNANYDISALTINVSAGDLVATEVADLQNPDIVARNAALIAPLGSIGVFGRPLVVYVKDSLFIAGFNSWNPFWAFSVPPTTVENASTIQGDLSDLLASGNEALVVVEALNEVDPAIFTNVRNYFYDDISILLPADQLYYGE